jgi:LPS-assembly protein
MRNQDTGQRKYCRGRSPRRKQWEIALLLLFLSLFTLRVQAAATKAQPGIKIISADRQSFSKNTFTAAGNVEIAWDEYRLYTDYLEFDLKTKELLAKSRVTLSSKETVISGDQFRFNLKKRTGEMTETYGQLTPTLRYTTDELSQVDSDTLAFKKLDFTPCAQCVPRWEITCANGKIIKEKYIEMKHILFKVKKIPLLYLPYLRYPLQRSTGLLLPLMGRSSQKGFFVLNGFYWVIKPNVDLTLGVDYYSSAGVGTSDELRYLFRNAEGNIKFYLFKYNPQFKLEADGKTGGSGNSSGEWNPSGKFDWLVKMRHLQETGFLKTRLRIDIDQQGDPNFLRFFSDHVDRVQDVTHRSSAALSSSLSKLKISLSAIENSTFLPSEQTSDIVRYLPLLEMNLNQQKVWKLPGYFSLSTSYAAVNWSTKRYGEQSAGTGEEENSLPGDITQTRFLLNPSYTLPLLKAPWASASLLLKSFHRYYPRSRDPEAKDLVILDSPLVLQYQSADFTVKGPVFTRIFEFKHSKIKHVIEPQIIFRYTTSTDEDEIKRLIKKDFSPFANYPYVRFLFTNRLLYKNKKGPASAREILAYTLQQDYYLDPVLANRRKTIGGIYPEFSQLSHTLRLNPYKNVSLDATLHYNHYLNELTYVTVSLDYRKPQSVLSGSFKYTRAIAQYDESSSSQAGAGGTGQNADSETGQPAGSVISNQTLGGSLNFDKKGFPVRLNTRVDYNIKNRRFTYGSLSLTCDYQCITFEAKFTVFRLSGREETAFRFGVSFGNLGIVRDLLGIAE